MCCWLVKGLGVSIERWPLQRVSIQRKEIVIIERLLYTINVVFEQASVSIKRLGEFLQNADLDEDNVQYNPNAGN